MDIIYEDENLLAVNKPTGVLVHSTSHTKEGESTLVDMLVARYPHIRNIGDLSEKGAAPDDRPGIVHRLDKDTSGIILVPKTQEYFEYLKELFQKREVVKIYRAIVYGNIKEERGTIEKPIGIKPGTVKRTIFGGKMIKPAITEYKVLQNFGNYSYLEIYPKTGRTHQIRVHLASIGHPVVGDLIYAPKRKASGAPRQMLHAYAVEFNAEPGKRIRITAEPPDDFADFLAALAKSPPIK